MPPDDDEDDDADDDDAFFFPINSTEVNEERTNIIESVMLICSSKFNHMALATFVIESFPQGFMR